MRLKLSITEATGTLDFDEMNTLIHKNCKQYLNLIRGKTPMLRGMKGVQSMAGIKDVRKDRVPFGMAPSEAAYLNDWLEKNGHARRDKSVLCNSSDEHVEIFGQEFMIFPLDPIKKYTWLHSPDINMDGDVGWEWNTLPSWIDIQKGGEDVKSKKVLDLLKMPFKDFFTTNKEFNIAYDSSYEMWIECDKYYFIASGNHGVRWHTSKQVAWT